MLNWKEIKLTNIFSGVQTQMFIFNIKGGGGHSYLHTFFEGLMLCLVLMRFFNFLRNRLTKRWSMVFLLVRFQHNYHRESKCRFRLT